MHKTLTVSVDEREYPHIKNFVNQFGGVSAFFRRALEEHGYQKEGLKEIAKRCREANLKETLEFDHLSGEGIE